MDYADLINQVGAIAKGAGALILGMDRPEVFQKEGHANFVTSADIASQQYIVDRLAPLLPQAHFYAEEQKDNQLCAGYNWIIDPIDGTTNFMRGYRHSAVSIGLVLDGESVMGAVYNPYADELFTAVKGGGAFLNGVPIRASTQPLTDALIVFGTAPYLREKADETFRIMKRLFLACGDIRRSGSAALDLCYVAAGRSDGFFEAVLSPWDYAASAVILREAGACIGTALSISFGYESPIPIIAGNREVFAEIRKAVAEG